MAIDNDTRQEWIKQALKPIPDFGYHGDSDLSVIGFTSFVETRDSDALARSNYRVILADLEKRFPDSVHDEHFGHWACGWLNHIMVDTRDIDAVDACIEWENALSDYPVADEEDFSNLEHQEYCEGWDNWARHDIARHSERAVENDDTGPHCHYTIQETCTGSSGEYIVECFEPTIVQEDGLRDWYMEQMYHSGGDSMRCDDMPIIDRRPYHGSSYGTWAELYICSQLV